jgi:hypothetical protein
MEDLKGYGIKILSQEAKRVKGTLLPLFVKESNRMNTITDTYNEEECKNEVIYKRILVSNISFIDPMKLLQDHGNEECTTWAQMRKKHNLLKEKIEHPVSEVRMLNTLLLMNYQVSNQNRLLSKLAMFFEDENDNNQVAKYKV